MWNKLSEHLQEELFPEIQIKNATTLTGGDINAVYKLNTSEGTFCVKVNSADKFPKMFAKEALGLKKLKENSLFTIPEVMHLGVIDDQSFLLLAYIDSSPKADNFWQQFGYSLAKMHQTTNETFGLDHNNYIGSLPQSNRPHSTWTDFFAEERLLFQTKLAFDTGQFQTSHIRKVEQLCHQLDQLFPQEQPALLHGDLWSGNYMVDTNGNPCLIDPAIYFGHREMDLAMMQLFGGFPSELYNYYHDEFPLEKGWQERIDLCNLYPLMVHVNLFGGGYVNQVNSILQRFV